jgi:hypothetical protein
MFFIQIMFINSKDANPQGDTSHGTDGRLVDTDLSILL